ncbi:hypothetical protein [Pandoraea anhela]|nr:hypothetical protein [Pandoraea anhela]
MTDRDACVRGDVSPTALSKAQSLDVRDKRAGVSGVATKVYAKLRDRYDADVAQSAWLGVERDAASSRGCRCCRRCVR